MIRRIRNKSAFESASSRSVASLERQLFKKFKNLIFRKKKQNDVQNRNISSAIETIAHESNTKNITPFIFHHVGHINRGVPLFEMTITNDICSGNYLVIWRIRYESYRMTHMT